MAKPGPRLRNSAKAIIIEDGRLLVTVNQNASGRYYLLPGGGQEGGESLHQALRRECLEETGADVETGDLLYLREYIVRNHEFTPDDGGSHQVEFMFACRLKTRPSHDSALTPDAWQVGLEWVPLEQLYGILFYPQALIPLLMDANEGSPVVGNPIYLGEIGEGTNHNGFRYVRVTNDKSTSLHFECEVFGPAPMHQRFQIRQCLDDACRFRYPAADDDLRGQACPRCGAVTRQAITIPHADERESVVPSDRKPIRHIDVLLDNIRSLYNVGSIFRTADGAGIRHLYLCGITPTPDNPKLAKTALGVEQAVGWSYHTNALDLINQKQTDHLVWALEDAADAQSLFNPPTTSDDANILLVIGNERTGVDPSILSLCDTTLHIPMRGVKRSLNVATAFGIATYALVRE